MNNNPNIKFRDNLESNQREAKKTAAYLNYLDSRNWVIDMIEEDRNYREQPSKYWIEELAGLDYMLDASPFIINKLREHCYHITGLRVYDYRKHHSHDRDSFVHKLKALQRQDNANLFVPESPMLGGFGHVIDNELVNIDTLKFYECLIALNKSGLLEIFTKHQNRHQIVLEIGAGWGGFAYQFKKLFPNVTYIIIDLPQTLLFSTVYLKTLFPDAIVLLYGEKPNERLLDDVSDYDFIFLPHFFLKNIRFLGIDLVMNLVSFQEMTSEQVRQYCKKAYELKCQNIYSFNRNRSPHNNQLTSVQSILSEYYHLQELRVLDVPYHVLKFPNKSEKSSKKKRKLKRIFKKNRQRLFESLKKNSLPADPSIYDYRHLIGKLIE